MNVLIAEDEQDLRQLLELQISKEGLKVFLAEDGIQALDIFNSNEIDIAVIDVMMPNLDGFGLLEQIRAGSQIPVIFLTARGEDTDKVLGLGLGADDYIVKPFSSDELMARIKAQLRRTYKYSSGLNSVEDFKLKIGDITFDKTSYSVYKGDRQVEFNAKELKLLEFFMENPGKAYTKKQLYEKVWEEKYYGDDNTIMVHISHLREKIEDNPKEPNYIKTIRGIGYKFQ